MQLNLCCINFWFGWFFCDNFLFCILYLFIFFEFVVCVFLKFFFKLEFFFNDNVVVYGLKFNEYVLVDDFFYLDCLCVSYGSIFKEKGSVYFCLRVLVRVYCLKVLSGEQFLIFGRLLWRSMVIVLFLLICIDNFFYKLFISRYFFDLN